MTVCLAGGEYPLQRDRGGHVKLRTWQARGARTVLGVRGDVNEIIVRPTAQS
jgi:hypothetical protein